MRLRAIAAEALCQLLRLVDLAIRDPDLRARASQFGRQRCADAIAQR
jgi:hypothetical protein